MDEAELILAPERQEGFGRPPNPDLALRVQPDRPTIGDVGRPVVEPVVEPVEPVADEQATLVITLGRKSYADVYIDGKKVGRVPTTPRYQVPPGPHELRLSSQAAEDFVRTFSAAPGGVVEYKGVLLTRKPVRVIVPEDYPSECLVRRDGEDLGTLLQTTRELKLKTADQDSKLEIRCPDGTVETLTFGPKDAGSSKYMPAPP